VTDKEFAKAIANLCALKRTTEFSTLQLEVWYGGLKSFPPWIVNRAIIELGVSSERFPEFGDLYQLCRRSAIMSGLITEPYSPNSAEKRPTITTDEINTIGSALGLVTKRKPE